MIQTEYGKAEGFKKDGCTVYAGIPFAKAPLGALAFRHPQKPDPWEGVFKADHGSSNPVQAQNIFAVGNNDLDCLYLNVFVPDHEEGQRLPVMVWIYGGSYATGGAGAVTRNSQDLNYDLCKFAAGTNCIVVSFNYRLNLYGFLNLSYLDDRFDRNNGLYDQIMAIRFVKDNITSFGGDESNITLFGQSAGGACILALMCMEEAKGLFSKVIVQSACIEHFFTEEESRSNTKLYLKMAGISGPSDLFTISEEKVMEANKTYASAIMRKADIRCAFSPVIDGVTLKQEPKIAVQQSDLPMLVGNTEHECNLYIQKIPTIAMPFVMKLLHLKTLRKASPYRQRVSDTLTDHIYVRPQLEILDGYKGPAWRYEFCHSVDGSDLGCCHASELFFLFQNGKTMDGKIIPANDHAGRDMQVIWGNFAGNNDPGWDRFKDKKSVKSIP